MTTDVVYVTNKGEGFAEALRQSDAAAAYRGLSKKEAIRLRLLTEEMLGLMRALTGERAADFWIRSEGVSFRLHLRTKTEMNNELRRRLLAVSSDGENAAATGVLGKLRDLFERMLEPVDGTLPRIYLNGWSGSEALPMNASAASLHSAALPDRSVWSLRRCVGSGPQEDWDGLEQSVIANAADDVEIGIMSNTVEMIVYKTFCTRNEGSGGRCE